jgi:hypothetical protein
VTREEERLKEASEYKAHWKRWGPYVAERAWGTVREDYSEKGTVWDYFPHEDARSRTYRWNEDGIAGICDRHQHICFALAFWNEQDPFLKERLFGLDGNQGNHGEDVKECYYYLDSTPTHSYMRMLYKYPHRRFPYNDLVEKNRGRSRTDGEFELTDTGIFDEGRYFDISIEYAKADADDICIRITAVNRGPETAKLHLLPTVWFRNRWSWNGAAAKPWLRQGSGRGRAIELDDPHYGRRWLVCGGTPDLLFTENETNNAKLYSAENTSKYVKDGINDFIVGGVVGAVNPDHRGTKAAAHYSAELEAGGEFVVKLRFAPSRPDIGVGADFDDVLQARKREADEFYDTITPPELSADGKAVLRQALGGMMWSKQYYHYVVKEWLEGDAKMPPPPPAREYGRNHDWIHLFNADVISMPDKWEYPWYAAWDLGFHCMALSIVDADFAKEQLLLMLREWYMHPNGQLPAYEWNLSDVNPPVHAWAALRVFRIERKRSGKCDYKFLERVFHKLLLNFTWWVNRKDSEGRNVFQGGFLGLDNIGLFDRSKPLPGGGRVEQADGTGWMGMYTLNLLAIAMELAKADDTYQDVASKFWEHFLYIAHAINHLGDDGGSLWDEQDGFYYDVLHAPDGQMTRLKIRSIAGLIPLFAVTTLDVSVLSKLSGFKRRMDWFIENRPDLTSNVAAMNLGGQAERRLLSMVDADQLRRILTVVFDENEFLSPYGIRSLSRRHADHPATMQLDGVEYRVDYEPGESKTPLFGGNSNWRGPVWFPLNYLLIESLQRYDYYYGDSFRIEFPTRSGKMMTLADAAAEISRRLTRLFLRDGQGRRPVHGGVDKYRDDANWRDLVLFYEYFHGDTGAGLGASHQTGWTGLVAKLIQQSGE